MRGRKPKPTHLKLVTGNPGRRPLNEREAVIAPDLPAPPPELSDEAKVEWGRVGTTLYEIGLLTKADRAVLAAYCQAYGRWILAEKKIAEMAKTDQASHGLLAKTTNGNIINNPLLGIANKAMSDMVRYAVELGMTPSARSRITATPPEEDDDRSSKYFR